MQNSTVFHRFFPDFQNPSRFGWLRSEHPWGCVDNLLLIQFRAKRPVNPAYPAELNTLGDHLRKARLDRGLSQPEVARILQVTSDTVTGWELNRHKPRGKSARVIIEFLGYSSLQINAAFHEAKEPKHQSKFSAFD
ncbi:MAG: helix-turn-helix transcriptional regulator [Lewinellaceae bacterium]|nr:helix-turn-helix transcriptional regulator [Lewinellaceae bacterium]